MTFICTIQILVLIKIKGSAVGKNHLNILFVLISVSCLPYSKVGL